MPVYWARSFPFRRSAWVLLCFPGRFEFGWRQISEPGVDPLFLIDILDKTANLFPSVSQIGVFIEIDFLFFDRANDAFGITVLGRFSHFRHADLGSQIEETFGIGRRSVLDSLIGVMNLRDPLGERLFKRSQGQIYSQSGTQAPATNDAGVNIHDDRQVDEFLAQPYVRDVRHPNFIWVDDLQTPRQVPIARKSMTAVGRVNRSFFDATLDVHFLHQPLDALAIDHQLVRIPSELGADSPGAIGWKLSGDFLDRLTNPEFIGFQRLIVVAALGRAE